MKAVEGVITMWDGVCERFGDSVEGSVVDAPSPNEVVNVVNMFLVGLRGEESFGEPGSAKEGPNVEIGVKVSLVLASVPKYQVCVGRNVITGAAAFKRETMLRGDKQVVVYIVIP